MTERDRRARVHELLEAAEVLADSKTSDGRLLRSRLRETTGLSPANIELGLERCLERQVSERDLQTLLDRVPLAPRALVLLSGNVFVAALRAVALARASSDHVVVRASRRDPALAEALSQLLPHAFQLTPELPTRAGDHVWAYGADATLRQVRGELPDGVVFHGHGSGLGAVVIEPEQVPMETGAAAIALDTALFDQRGCLSPRLVIVAGGAGVTRDWAEALQAQLSLLERTLPPGPVTEEEAAARRREQDAATYAFEVLPAGSGWVSLATDGRVVLPSAARCLHVVSSADPSEALSQLGPHLTCLAIAAREVVTERLARAFPGARRCGLGLMQCPPLDGPVDLRGSHG